MSPPRSRAIAALLGLLAIVLGSVGVHRHVSVEVHARCEHGAEVHVERVGVAVAAPETGGGPTLAAPVWWETEGDHHCGVIAPIVCAEPDVAVSPATLPIGFATEVPGVSRVAIATALFRLAPKTSPPIALV
ncbi:MAG TPA: hypothetical protein VM261_22235 [Kofleriaceae bacterium]|nr:hypothetical protein [Kofleriaceae bacterium]